MRPGARLGALSLTVLLLYVACGGSSEPGGGDDRPLVIAAFYPLEFVAASVGGPGIEVRSLTPPGVEPHDLELSSGQIRDLAEADLVLLVGQDFQPAVEDAVAGLDDARRFDVLEGQDLLQDDDEEGGAPDPHVWLDPMRLSAIASEVATRLSEIAPGRATSFRDNSDQLERDLQKLDEEFAAGLDGCESDEIVTSHAAFGYLAARYDLDQVSISGIDPEAEPSPARLAEIARYVDDHDVTTIFFEELAPSDLAETLARETGARTDVLSPLESAPERGDYFDQMRLNLERLRGALNCA